MVTAKVQDQALPEKGGTTALTSFVGLLRTLRRADRKTGRTIFLMIAAIFAVILLNTYGQLRLNRWQGTFYDSIARRDWPGFLVELTTFFVIVAFLLVLVVGQTWLTETVKVHGRRWITQHILSLWLAPRRAYLLGFAGDIAHNPDQRISQDAYRLADLSISFFIGIGQATMLLATFMGVLWQLSSSVVFSYGSNVFTIPGYMVWCTLAFSGIGSVLTYLIGRPLVRINAERYASEGEFRTQLVRVSENAAMISLERGEQVEQQAAALSLGNLLGAMQKIANTHARVTWVTSGYGWIGLVFPIIVASPGYFAGNMTLGSLMMVVGGFNQVQNSLRWFIDNYPSIAEWHAVLDRVRALIDAIDATDKEDPETGRIAFAVNGPECLFFENLAVCLPGDMTSCILLEDRNLRVCRGERILFVGALGSGKTTLAMALAGLWPWGRGTIRLPQTFNALFVSERPYIPQGTLMRALAYPAAESSVPVERAAEAMKAVGLESLAGQLDVSNHWYRDLSLSEQQRLGIARLLIHAPDWAVLDNCLGALDDETGVKMLALLKERLPRMGVVAMADRTAMDNYFTRRVSLGGHASLQPFTLVNGVAKLQKASA